MSPYAFNNSSIRNPGQPVGCPVAMLWEFKFLCQAEAQADSVGKAAFFVVSAEAADGVDNFLFFLEVFTGTP